MNEKIRCTHCEKEFSKFGIKTHIWRMHTDEGKKFDPNAIYVTGARVVWNKGLTKDTSERVKQYSITLKDSFESGTVKPSGCYSKEYWTEEKRKKLSNDMKKTVEENPDSYSKNNVSGRVKNIEYNGVVLKGTWELIMAKWLDSMNIKWTNETKPHSYFWNDNWHLYFPDFYLSEQDVFIEVKGFKRERDISKWNHFKPKLVIIEKNNINALNSFETIDCLIEKCQWK
jgi:hypothetical protein